LDSKEGNYFEIFNELLYCSILTLILILVGDTISNIDIRYSIGWIIVITVLTFILINFIYLFVLMGISIAKFTRIYYRKLKIMLILKRKVKKMMSY